MSLKHVCARIRNVLAATFLDAPRYGLALRFPALAKRLKRSWVDLHNRGEHLKRSPQQQGILCDWRWTSPLFYCQREPRVGQRLLERALGEWPIRLRDAPERLRSRSPEISFIIGHHGSTRVPHLLATLASIAGLNNIQVECVVVEQAKVSVLSEMLPEWVRHIHTVPPSPNMLYSRSWAFNVGARAARGQYLVFHDNDVCVPSRYGAELVAIFKRGFEAVRLQRFVFYLNEAHTDQIFRKRCVLAEHSPQYVMQNCEGHTIAVEREAYFALGGHDEAFVGWGGEDNEFCDRLRTRRFHDHAYLPFVHLFHHPQQGKGAIHANSAYFESRMRIPTSDRIGELRSRPFGSLQGPNPESEKNSIQYGNREPATLVSRSV